MNTNKNIKKAKGISFRLLVVGGIFIFSLLSFIAISNEMVLEKENNLDLIVFQQLKHLTNGTTTQVMLWITFFGSNYFLLPAYLLLIIFFLYFKKDRRLSLDVTAIGITSTILLFSLKAIFRRDRPLDPLIQNVNGFSFPSGHSFCSFTFFGLLIYILWNQNMNRVLRWFASVFFFLFACAIAFSRVYLHVHYASDVVAGFCLCIVWLGLSFWLIRKYSHKLQ